MGNLASLLNNSRWQLDLRQGLLLPSSCVSFVYFSYGQDHGPGPNA